MESKSDRTSQTVFIAAGEACYPTNQRYTTGSQSCIDVQRKEAFWLKQLHIPHMHQLHVRINTHRGKKNLKLNKCVYVYLNMKHLD